MSLCVSKEEEEILVKARSWSASLDLSSTEGEASLGGKMLRTFIVFIVVCFLDQFLGFLVPRWRLYEQKVSIILDLLYFRVL